MAQIADERGESYELPKMTLKVREDFRAALNPKSDERTQVTATLKLMKSLLPEEYVSRRCGGKTVDSVDVVALAVLAEEVWDAYQAPLTESRTARQTAQYETMQPIIEDVKHMTEALERHSKANRQGFSRVV